MNIKPTGFCRAVARARAEKKMQCQNIPHWEPSNKIVFDEHYQTAINELWHDGDHRNDTYWEGLTDEHRAGENKED